MELQLDWLSIDWDFHYYLANRIWVYGNLVLILPFLTACLNRFRHPEISLGLWTDHLARLFLFLTCAFYLYEMPIKYLRDGGESVCQKAFFIHHLSSLFVIPPLFLNSYIPWFVNPIGFLHGFLVFFPEAEALNYLYAGALLYLHFMLYQRPFAEMRGYGVTRWALNGIWVFCLMVLIGDCSNYLPLEP